MSRITVQLTATALLLLLCQLGLRWQAGAARARPPVWVLALDAGPLLLGAVLFGAVTARPLLGALLVATLAIGLAIADAVKRQVLHEPVVFADRAELGELFRHPEFYLPFAGTKAMVAAAAAALAIIAAAAWAIPPLWPWSAWPGVLAAVLVVAAFRLPGRPPLLPWLQRRYESLAPTRDAAQDGARWGMLAGLVIHATLACAERPARQAAPAILRLPRHARRGPVVMMQLESFFDPRRLHAALPADLLPGLDACRAGAAAWGPLAVPSWGANTVRTEFAALTGLGADALGLDRFNPYERFARTRLDAIAWRMQALGRRTICLHPFDTRFYGRHHVIPALGFQRFIGPERFPAATKTPGYISDRALGEVAAEIVAAEGPDLFLCVISVGNHGPWLADRDPADAAPLPPALATLPEAAALRRYLAGLRQADTLFPSLMTALQTGPEPGVLLAYGDHQPSLPALFDALGHRDTDTDYVLWDTAEAVRPNSPPERSTVEALPQRLLDKLGHCR